MKDLRRALASAPYFLAFFTEVSIPAAMVLRFIAALCLVGARPSGKVCCGVISLIMLGTAPTFAMSLVDELEIGFADNQDKYANG